MILPEYVKYVIERLENNGFSAYAVGGCVRDSLSGSTPDDYDVATSAKPEEVKNLFPKTFDTGIKHGTVTVLYEKNTIEVTTYRKESEYTGNRRPSSVAFVDDIVLDLARRDFTINAMAYNPRTGLVDPYGGSGDLRRGIIRCVGDANERFCEDALRMLRAIRFSCRLGFEICDDTIKGIENNAELINNISAERIATELEKMLMSDYPERMMLLYQTGLSAHILPWFDVCMQTEQNTPYHIYSVGEHILKVVCNSPKNKYVRLAAFLHDCGKPYVKTTDCDGTDHFKGHEEKSAQMASEILKKLRFDNKTISIVKRLVLHHRYDIMPDKKNVRHAVYNRGSDIFPYLTELMYADSKAHSKFAAAERITRLDKIKKLYDEIVADGDALSLKELDIDGTGLCDIGITGTKVGEYLLYLLDKVLDNPKLNKKEILLDMAKKRNEEQ